jgi:hypothetical protein
MSLTKSVPDGLMPQECKRLHLREPLPVPYVPMKDEVQEEVSKMRNLLIKTSIEKDTTLNFPMWHNNGTKEAFLMHVMGVLDAIKKHGHFKDYKKAQKAYVKQKEAVKSEKAGLALLDGTSKGLRKLQKSSKRTKEAGVKAKKAEAKSKEAGGATKVPKDPMKANFQANLKKAKKAVEDAKGAMTAAASDMFAFYSNLLSPESKYVWNKIVIKQTKSNPYLNLQGVSLEGPRGMSHESLNNCVMFHLLGMFPINRAEQEM